MFVSEEMKNNKIVNILFAHYSKHYTTFNSTAQHFFPLQHIGVDAATTPPLSFAVIDPRTGKYPFIPTSPTEWQRDLSEVVVEEEEKRQVISVRQKKGRDGDVQPTPEGVRTPKAKNVNGIGHVHAESACSSMRSSRTFQSTARGLKKKAKTSALLMIKIGDVVINRGVVAPMARKIARDWKSLKSLRARYRAERRSKTLVWFEDRVKAAKRANEMEQQRQQSKRRNLWRNRLKKEREARQARDVLNEIRSECTKATDAKYAASLEQEKVQNWFLSSNDGWKMQSLTKKIEEEEDRRRRQKEDAEADKVREGEKQRQAAAAEYVAEYDCSEVITQVCLRTMRRSGFIPAVNAPPAIVEESPLETDSYLLLRLKSDLFHPIGGGMKKSRGSGDANNLSPDRTSTPLLEARRHSAEVSPSTSREMHPMPSPKAPTGVTAVSRSRSVAERGPQVLHSSGPATTRKRKTRGRKKSSGAFEVDLLRFRSVEEIRGWKLGALGGLSLAADFSNGACPRLKVLRLGWCSLGDRGTQAIMSALGGSSGTRGTGKMLQELRLHGNAITAGGGSTVWKALSTGVLPALRVLDLGNNSLGEVGGREVAHHLLMGRGTWPRLVTLDLSRNAMRDRGVEAVIKAVTAPGVALAPDIEYINLRFNRLSRAAMERTACPPGFLVL